MVPVATGPSNPKHAYIIQTIHYKHDIHEQESKGIHATSVPKIIKGQESNKENINNSLKEASLISIKHGTFESKANPSYLKSQLIQ